MGDRLDFVIRGRQQFGGVLHAQVDNVMHRTAAEFTTAQSAQVLGAEVAMGGEAIEGPRFMEAIADVFPKIAEAIIRLPWAGESHHIRVDDFDPLANRCRGRLMVHLVV